MTLPALVVHVVYRFGIGGLENGIVNLVNGMSPQRWRHVILSLTDVDAGFAARIARPDVRYIALGKKPGHLVSYYPRLYRLFRELQPAIVHTRNLAALEAVVPAWAAGVPVRIHGEHGWDRQDPEGRRQRYRYVRRLYRPFVSRYVALSAHLEGYLEHGVGVARPRISQIYNGVDTARFFPAAGARAAIAGCPFQGPNDWLAGWVGRMDPVKDPMTLAHAFLRALRMSPAAAERLKLIVVGDGALREKVAAALDRVHVRDKVWFAGERSDIADVMRGLDCFVLPSLAEGVSNTVLEAMASRLPIVATRVGGNAELIESGMTGTLVPAGNPEALAGAMLNYLNDGATARRHAKAAQRQVETRFSLARMLAEYTALYERAIARAPVATRAPGTVRS